MLWGAVSVQGDNEVGHYCFASFEIIPPVEGKLYAGQHSERFVMATALEDDKSGG